MKGYFEIGIYQPKYSENVGTLWRSAFLLGASGIFVIGAKFKHQASDIPKTWQQIPMRKYADFEDFLQHKPIDSELIGIELGGSLLTNFKHPKQAIYLLGSEGEGLPVEVFGQCDDIVRVESLHEFSYNVSVAGSIVMYDRLVKI